MKIAFRGIVQLVEYRSPKPQVVGSNPTAPVQNRRRLLSVFYYIRTPVFCGFAERNTKG